MNQENMLSLCDPHNSIIHEYGCENSCTKVASICRKGCSEYEHKQKVSRHEFIHARQLYTLVSHLRQDYTSFSNSFKEVYLKRFLNQLREAVESFQENINSKMQAQHSLVDIYSRNSGQIFQTILEDKYQDLQFAQLKCKEVFQLKYFYNSLLKSTQEDQEKRVTKILTKQLEDHLRALKLIPALAKPQKEYKVKTQKVFQGQNIDSIIEKTSQLLKQNGKEQQIEHVDSVLIKIKDKLHLLKDDFQLSQKLQKFQATYHYYLELTNAEELMIAARGIISASSFWLYFFKFIGTTKIKTLKVITNEQTEQSKSIQNNIYIMFRDKLTIKFATGDWENNIQPLLLVLNR